MRNINYFKEEERFEMILESRVRCQNVKREPEGISDQKSTTNILLKAE